MEKLFIKNRSGEKIAVLLEKSEPQKGLAFVMHGLGGFKEQLHIQAYAEAFLENGYTVVRFDTRNTYGESEGKYEDATTTNYYEDLEDVISWARQQPWYEEPFYLVGHSLGSLCVALYAENHPEQVKALAPTSTVVSGKLSAGTSKYKDTLEEWKRTGWREEVSESKPGLIKRLKWAEVEDRLRYDLLPKADKLTMPVLLMVGSEDDGTPLEHQKLLYDKLPGKKELYVVEGAEHTFREDEHLREIKEKMKNWISSFEE